MPVIRALLTLVVLSPALCRAECVSLEISATGWGAHGAAVVPRSAPHLLIEALDKLPAWIMESPDHTAARIVEITAAEAINIIPARAASVVEITATRPDTEPGQTAIALQSSLGSELVVTPLERPCVEPSSGSMAIDDEPRPGR